MEDEFYIDYAKLDAGQKTLVDKEIDPDRVFIDKKNLSMVVTGTAGSGKSLIAIHKAKQVAALTDSYLVIVYTKTLKKYFKDGFAKDDETVNNNGKKYGKVNPEKVFHYADWKKLENKSKVKYLIVDECQDFSKEEIDELISYADICFFFGDTDQSIMGFKKQTQDVDATAHVLGFRRPTELYKNYRLTIENASLAEKIGKVEDVVEKCVRHGEKPELIETSSIDAQLDEIIRIKKNKTLNSVGILMPFNTKERALSAKKNGYISAAEPEKLSVEYVKDYFVSKGEPIEYKYSADMDTEMDLNFHSSNAKVMTWWCAKGLQFKDVFIPNCQINYGDDKRSALYVAITRVSENLHLLYSGNLSVRFPQKGSNLYKSNNVDYSVFQ